MKMRKTFWIIFSVVVAALALWVASGERDLGPWSPRNAPEGDRVVIQVFFSNRAEDPQAAECGRTYPVTRQVSRTSAVARVALEELLKGPTAEEREVGYFTSINDGVRVNLLTIEDGVARADFSARIEEAAGGSCRVAVIRSQIANTLMQFSSVDEAVISVEGRVEEALQP